MSFRNRIYRFKTEDDLFEYFCIHAHYSSSAKIYTCIGLCASETDVLWEHVKDAWLDDKKAVAKELLKRHV